MVRAESTDMGAWRPFFMRAGVAVAVILATVGASVLAAPPSQAQSGEGCPAAPFTDRELIPAAHVSNVDCAYEAGIAQGLADGRFAPGLPVRRDQVVSFLQRTLDTAGFADRLPAATDQGFRDLEGNVHAEAINVLAEVGVVKGITSTRFDPGAHVTRAQLASLVLRALAWVLETEIGELQSDTDRFVDVAASDVHRRNINGAADRGLVRGVSPERFAPGFTARRDQVVTLLFRLHEALPDGSDDDDGTDDGGGAEPGPAFPPDAAVHGIEVSSTAVVLSWGPAEDPEAVVEYRVEQVTVAGTAGTAALGPIVATTDGLSVEVTGLNPGTTYTFRVLAVDASARVSEDGPSVTVTTLDAQPPITLDLELAADRTFQNSLVDTRDSDGYAGAVGPDGTQYLLRIPRGALLSPEPIVLTPIVGVDNVPGEGRLIAGVKLEPEGLLLHKPATLRISLPEGASPPAAGQEMPMAFEGDGEAVRLAELDPAEADYVVPVSHFSGVVISEGGAPERQEVLDRAPTRESQLAGQIAEGTIRERAASLTGSGGDPDWTTEQEALMRRIDEERVRPLLEAAKTNDVLAQQAVTTALSWLRMMELLGMATDADHDRVITAVIEILRHAYEKAKARCLPNADVRDGLKMLSIIRTLTLLGTETYPVSEATVCIDQEFDIDFSATTWHRNTSEIADGLEEVSGSLSASMRVTPAEPQHDRPVFFTGETVPVASGITVSPLPNVCNVRNVTLESDAVFPVYVEPNLNPTRDTPGTLLVRIGASHFSETPLRANLEYSSGYTTTEGCNDVEGRRFAHFMGTDLHFAFDDLAFRVPVDGSITRSGSRLSRPCPTNCYPFDTSMTLSLNRVN